MALPAALDFAKNPSASQDRMNLAMANLDDRLKAMEAYRPNFDALLAELQAIGLQRLNDALLPVYQKLTAIVSLGVLMNARSASAVPIALGSAHFTLSADDADRFAYAGFMIAVSQADTRNALAGRFVSYDRPSGLLVLDVTIASGAGIPGDWMIMPSVPPLVPAAVIDAGSDAAPQLQAVPWPFAQG